MGRNRFQIFVAFTLLSSLNFVSALFEYICTEKGLFTPYLNVYKGRNGTKIYSGGPGFYDMRDHSDGLTHSDIYLCINGPAYLYFSHNTTLGEVFETPEFDVYTHKCGVYNKPPSRGHTHQTAEDIKKLHGILLMGDPKDYRNPAVQLFTAPTYNYKTSEYENATSLFIFGNEECTLSKNGTKITILAKSPTDPKKPEYCIRAFGEENANEDEEETLRATTPITVTGCKPKAVPTPAAGTSGTGTSAGNPPPPPAAGASGTGTPAGNPPPPPTPPDPTGGKIKKRATPPDPTPPGPPPPPDPPSPAGPPPPPGPTQSRPVPSQPPPPTGPKTIEIKECIALPTLEEECKKGKPDPAFACSIFDTMTGTKDPGWDDGSKWRKDVIELIGEIFTQAACSGNNRRLPKLINRVMGFYLLQGLKSKSAAGAGATGAGASAVAGSGSSAGAPPPSPPPAAPQPPSPAAPTVQPPGGTIRKKRNATSGSGANPNDPPSGANPLPPSNPPNGSGGTGNTIDPNSTGTNDGGSNSAAKPDASVGKREVWKFILEELQNCLKSKPRLDFKEEKKGDSMVTFIMKNGQSIPILHLKEEAENEFAFNWVIDAHWKMFATVLGICTPSTKVKTTVISSRFYTSYIEDFFYPINSTWVEFKDNMIFQFILEEFYNKKTEVWLNDCVEASFIHSNSASYRPLRPLRVSDLHEDNYFIDNSKDS